MVYQVTCSLYAMIFAPLLCQMIGMVWYGPLLGQAWLAEMNIAQMPSSPPVMPFLLTIVSNFITTFLIINIQHILAVATSQQALTIGWVYWVATIGMRIPHYAFGMKSLRLFLIDSAFDLTIALAVSLAVFKLHFV